MSTAETNEITEIMSRVTTWSPPQRIALARRILETLDTPAVAEPEDRLTLDQQTRGWPVERALGLLKTDQEPPDDEACRQIVEEERWKKYGS